MIEISIISKHAKQRYSQRFGNQDEKEIIRRAKLGTQKTSENGEITSVWGNIVFKIVGDTITTVWPKNKKHD